MTRKPLNAPHKPPTTSAAAIDSQIDQPCMNASAMTTPVRPSVAAIERSISPVITISATGSAMIATSPMLSPT